MTNKKYYVAPDDSVFKDIQKCSCEIWRSYDDTYGYASEKCAWVNKLGNIGDNYMTIIAAFDIENQNEFYLLVQPETLAAIDAALESVGNSRAEIQELFEEYEN